MMRTNSVEGSIAGSMIPLEKYL